MNCVEKISVIVPVYKVEDYLEKCVESLRIQTYDNIEIILVDDGSPDNCPQMCDNYAIKDARIVVIHQENAGVSVARNNGIANATGDYIAFVDSDDYVEKNYLETLYNNLNGCAISECGTAMLYDDRIVKIKDNLTPCTLSWWKYLTETNLNGFLSYAVVYAKLFKRELFDGIEFPVGRRNGEDEATTYKVVYKAKEVSRVYDNLYYYRQRESGASHNEISSQRLDDCELLFDEKISFFKEKHEPELSAFFCAKKAIRFISFFKNTSNVDLKKRCFVAINESCSVFSRCKIVPLKYKLFVRYFLFVNRKFKK